MAGTLYVVATPIGNLEDLSPRALRTLEGAAWIVCEDTRRTRKLLARHGIEARLRSCHKFNERARIEPLLELLRSGDDLALVSDGGTPALSDPGTDFVRAAAEEGIRVVPIPGPSAPTALLSVAGMPADRFVFEGFLPRRAGTRRRRLRELQRETRPVVAFEAPHRILQTLDDLEEILGERRLVLGRELTKQHETILRGSARELKAALGSAEGKEVKGEIALVLAPAEPDEEMRAGDARVERAWEEALEASAGNARDALRRAARALGVKRSELYRSLVEMGKIDAR